MIDPVKRRLGSLGVMCAGVTGVLGLVLAMNRFAPPPPKPESATHATFVVPVRKNEQKTHKRRPKPKRRRKSPAQRVAPPNLLSQLSGASFGIPGLDSLEGVEVSDSLAGDTGNLVMTEDSVDDPPRPRLRSAPAYPPRARARGVTGSVTLNLLINARGDVEQVKILEADPPGVFDQAAVESVKTWKFEPASYQGEPVRVWAKQILRFDLT